jgi:phosphohistidine phosphatase SixA
MRLLFIRHAPALDRLEWYDDDVFRPLTQRGEALAQKTFAKLSKIIKMPDMIFSSEAVRAKQTADILSTAFGVDVKLSTKLNPGATFKDIKSLLQDNIAFVGHEPDFSDIIQTMTGASIRLKKGGIVELEYDMQTQKGFLKLLLTPKIIS